MKSLHSVLFFLPDELSETTVYNIVIGFLCILLGFSLVAIYRRIKYGSSFSVLEGMEGTANTTDSAIAEIQSQTAALQTTYDKLTNEATNQKGRIDANSQTLMKALSPNQSNDITHANIDADDPSKTKIPNIDMS